MTVTFTVYGRPQGKARPRFKVGGGAYTLLRTKEYENQVKTSYLAASGGYSFGKEAIKIDIVAYYNRAKSNKSKYPTIKPDFDNIEKIVCDALNGIAYDDDKQVIDSNFKKRFAEIEQPPRIEVTVNNIE